MARENIYQSLEVFYEKIDQCPLKDRQFNFFELVYVISGIGDHIVNENKIAYTAGDLFLITPNDYHGFDLNGICEFMVIRFGENYIKEYQWKSIDHIECLLYYASHLSGSVLVNNEDQKMMSLLIQNLQQAIEHESIYNEDLTRHLVNAIIVIAARNIAVIKPKNISSNTDVRILQILDYIQENIRLPKLLKVEAIANEFGLSPTYLGSYFRKQCNESIQQYISSYKIRLIEHRLRFSDKRVHEIADEFGFADESHINKFFKRHKGKSLRAYRLESA
ncbi:AraC family transcriptional regulator [Chryseobacterium jejuense]|uniref:Multiple antibiotic resistance protein marA n=1 Tax=Chryseobacterium jejuense TaxID=445960 RepID=A0A2X2V7X6_CHRJE|nr:AraC family transcriptional regulator [Chryseobacterium jejuense]SDI37174.1 transcriptional regulator, AraC family [Chryseobacterium jejuense]SQB26862.1 Multiple antibiotic resistance protein marA [Chryseobacterium jejuense]